MEFAYLYEAIFVMQACAVIYLAALLEGHHHHEWEWRMRKQDADRLFTVRLQQRLGRIAQIIESVDNRCATADGDVTKTLDEMNQSEISEIWELSKPYLYVQ